jgi:hypothetical protein
MINPETIHIIVNASDGWERFQELNIQATRHVSREQITLLLSSQTGKLFRLIGWAGEPPAEVTLSVETSGDDAFMMTNHLEPPFTGLYSVATEPAPRVLMPHGDYRFDLVKVEP